MVSVGAFQQQTVMVYVSAVFQNNLGDGMVRQWQDLFFENRYSGTDKSLHKKDFVKAVEADGFGFAMRITRNEEVRAALEKFLAHKGPALLEVMIDQGAHVYPMVGPGLGYKDMITGPYIQPRVGAGREEDEEPSDGGSMF